MDKRNKLILKKTIESRIAELQDIQLSIDASPGEKTETLHDEATRVDVLSGISIDSALLEKNRRELSALQLQLKHIDDNSFGECASCGDEIPVARLTMVPTARHCIACAEQQELKK